MVSKGKLRSCMAVAEAGVGNVSLCALQLDWASVSSLWEGPFLLGSVVSLKPGWCELNTFPMRRLHRPLSLKASEQSLLPLGFSLQGGKGVNK